MFATVNGVFRSNDRSMTGLLLRRSTATQAISRTTATTTPPTTTGEPHPDAPARLNARSAAASPAPTSNAPGKIERLAERPVSW